MSTQGFLVALAAAHTAAIVAIGYVLLGFVGMALFAFGFVGGLMVWLVARDAATFADIRLPYFLTLGFFVLHKVEERELDFFPALSQLTGVPVPQEGSPLALLLYALAAAWLLVPLLMRRGNSFGHYLAWTFFVSMGLVELAHFVFPLFEERPYGYFPGMASVVLLAPAAWWGVWRLSRGA
jgi:hypothetical protein